MKKMHDIPELTAFVADSLALDRTEEQKLYAELSQPGNEHIKDALAAFSGCPAHDAAGYHDSQGLFLAVVNDSIKAVRQVLDVKSNMPKAVRLIHDDIRRMYPDCMDIPAVFSFKSCGRIFIYRWYLQEAVALGDFIPVRMDSIMQMTGDMEMIARLYEKMPDIGYMLHFHCYSYNAPFVNPNKERTAADMIEAKLKAKFPGMDQECYKVNLSCHGCLMMAKRPESFIQDDEWFYPMD